MMRCLLPFVLLSFAFGPAAQTITLPSTPSMRYVDWSQDLDRPDLMIVIGRLGKPKEGRRERLADGQLGAGNRIMQISGTQYFKVAAQAAVAPVKFLLGKGDKVVLSYDVQIARLPDGKEQRQSMTGTAAPLEEGLLALWVVVPKSKGKGLDLLHVIPFDKNIDKGPDGELSFRDSMSDFAAVNQRVHAVTAALTTLEAAKATEAVDAAKKELQRLLDDKPSLKKVENETLLTQHVLPLEQRAQQRLAGTKDKPADAGDK